MSHSKTLFRIGLLSASLFAGQLIGSTIIQSIAHADSAATVNTAASDDVTSSHIINVSGNNASFTNGTDDDNQINVASYVTNGAESSNTWGTISVDTASNDYQLHVNLTNPSNDHKTTFRVYSLFQPNTDGLKVMLGDTSNSLSTFKSAFPAVDASSGDITASFTDNYLENQTSNGVPYNYSKSLNDVTDPSSINKIQFNGTLNAGQSVNYTIPIHFAFTPVTTGTTSSTAMLVTGIEKNTPTDTGFQSSYSSINLSFVPGNMTASDAKIPENTVANVSDFKPTAEDSTNNPLTGTTITKIVDSNGKVFNTTDKLPNGQYKITLSDPNHFDTTVNLTVGDDNSTPSQPSNPGNGSSTPSKPSNPGSGSSTPSQPSNPGSGSSTSSQPSNPITPSNPVIPSVPSTPVNPSVPENSSSNSQAPVIGNGIQGNENNSNPESSNPHHVLKGDAIYAVKSIYSYKNPNFKKSERIKSYPKQARVNRPEFVIKGFAHSKSGQLRYKVQQYNPYTGKYIAGTTGYITASNKYIVKVYYQGLPNSKQIKVINKTGVKAYKTLTLKNEVKHYNKNTILKVTGIKHHKYTTRYRLTNGTYITTNKKFVINK